MITEEIKEEVKRGIESIRGASVAYCYESLRVITWVDMQDYKTRDLIYLKEAELQNKYPDIEFDFHCESYP